MKSNTEGASAFRPTLLVTANILVLALVGLTLTTLIRAAETLTTNQFNVSAGADHTRLRNAFIEIAKKHAGDLGDFAYTNIAGALPRVGGCAQLATSFNLPLSNRR